MGYIMGYMMRLLSKLGGSSPLKTWIPSSFKVYAGWKKIVPHWAISISFHDLFKKLSALDPGLFDVNSLRGAMEALDIYSPVGRYSTRCS